MDGQKNQVWQMVTELWSVALYYGEYSGNADTLSLYWSHRGGSATVVI